MLNIDDLFDHLSRVDTGRPVFTDFAGRTFSRPQFATLTRQVAGGLEGLGLTAGSAVSIIGLNSVEFIASFFGAMLAGNVASPLNIRWSPPEMVHALNDSGAECLFIDDVFLPMLPALKENAPKLKHVIHIGKENTPEGAIPFADVLTDPITLDPARDPDSEAVIVYTGGTTGMPKGVVQTQCSILASVMSMVMADLPAAKNIMALGMPMFHTIGWSTALQRLIQREASAVVMPMLRPDLFAAAIEKFGANCIGAVPAVLQALTLDAHLAPELREKVIEVVYGASPISEGALKLVLGVFPNAQLRQGYGMFEVGMLVFLDHQFHVGDMARIDGAGQVAAPYVKLRIEDEDGNELPTNTPGEIVFYGPTLMKGYLNQPDATAAVMRNGGLRTGDVGEVDEMGIVYVRDRMKDMIITGGENVYSAEVERVVSTHSDVADVAVIGVPHAEWGEAVHAVIVPAGEARLTADQLREFCKASLAGYKCPLSVSFSDELPRSAMMKVLKHELRAKVLEAAA
ncbi:class I adenylate-forming enzyme family protein [Tropicibacter sp. Alg240-R139]|uniref:class I adenylate-forming enzyme family protein n=1 Tax=Tropicibacter sp. Alg240-R139 TaxID=2305991 RepID=UPI0013DFD0F1|nr:AMP-binding protein [Tropicibacter sp. Alg240-R139]